MKKLVLTATIGIALFAASETMAQYELMQFVQQRNILMFDMQSAYWPMLAIKKGESTDLSAAAEAAKIIGTSIDKVTTLFPVGTAKGEITGTRARPEIWSDAEGFHAAADALKVAAAGAQEAAEAGDIEVFKARFDALAEACTGCHTFRPSGGGKYRFPK